MLVIRLSTPQTVFGEDHETHWQAHPGAFKMSASNPCRSLFLNSNSENFNQKEVRMDASRAWGVTMVCEGKDKHGRVTRVPVVLDLGEYGQQASFVDVFCR